MTAGLIAYRLCDREYDCDACPLDAALRGDAPPAETAGAGRESWASRWDFRADRRYHSSHSWVQSLGDGTVRCGLDPFAARLLGHATSVVLPPVESRVRKGHVGCWIMDGTELIPLSSALSGTVIRANHAVQADPALLAASPYDAGWLLEIRCEEPREGLKGLTSAGEQRRRTERDLKSLGQRVSRYLGKEPSVGPTLADGGRRVTELRQILGSPRYNSMVLSFLK
jgi:glycine cleavage system H protein